MPDVDPINTETTDDVVRVVADNDVRFIRLWFTDVLGTLKSFSINASDLDDAFEGGMGFDGSSITGFNPIEESDMIAMPDPTTFTILPWRPEERAVGRMFCDVQVPGGEPYEGDPRWILRRALKRVSPQAASWAAHSARTPARASGAAPLSPARPEAAPQWGMWTLMPGAWCLPPRPGAASAPAQ